MDTSLKSVAILRAFNANGTLVCEERLILDDYYDESHPLIDKNAYRKKLGVRKIRGILYGEDGRAIQDFENIYSENGDYLHGKTAHEDGTVTED
jgi:hypothetical protein